MIVEILWFYIMKILKTFDVCHFYFIFLIFYSVFLKSVEGTGSYNFVLMDHAVQEGKKQYELLLNKAPGYSSCWTKAVKNLHNSCKFLSDDSQCRIALEFANCFLEKAGLDTYVCFEDMMLSECIENMNERAFTVYTEFFTHTQSICFYLQNQLWQQQTEDTINKLSDTSSKVSENLDASKRTQEQILNLQQESLHKQQRLLKSGESLTAALERSRTSVKVMFEEFKATTTEHRVLIFEIFDRIRKLQELFLTEFSLFYTLVFYVIVVVISYLITATARTNGARLWLFATMTVCVICERIVTTFSMNEEVKKEVLYGMSGPMNQRIWICRKVACSIGVLILLWCSYRYKNYKVLNNKLLLEIHKQISEMKTIKTSAGINAEKPNTVKEQSPNGVKVEISNTVKEQSPDRILNHYRKNIHIDYYSSDDNLSDGENFHYLLTQENIGLRKSKDTLPKKITAGHLSNVITSSNIQYKAAATKKRQSSVREAKSSSLPKERYNLRHHSRASER